MIYIRTDSQKKYKCHARAEWDKLNVVMVSEPGIETFFAILDPDPHYFRGRFNFYDAVTEHRDLVKTLRDSGVTVLYLKDYVVQHPDFERLFEEAIEYFFVDDAMNKTGQEYIERLKEENKELTDDMKFQYVCLNFIIKRLGFDKDQTDELGVNRSGVSQIHIKKALSNLYFMRDQQIITREGAVMSRMRWAVRNTEQLMTAMALEVLDENNIVYKVPDMLDGKECKLEGGDFIPMGDYCLIGSQRTTLNSVKSIINAGGFGTKEVAYVESPTDAFGKYKEDLYEYSDPKMDIMHLDTWFNVLDEDLVMTPRVLSDNAHVKVFDAKGKLKYTTTLTAYIQTKRIKILDIPADMQPEAFNFLLLDRRKIIPFNCKKGLEEGSWDDLKEKLGAYNIEIVTADNSEWGIDISNLAEGFGGIHCMTCPIQREE